jgi:GTPase
LVSDNPADSHQSEQAATRSGIVALAGKPNVGKSTLLNAILGQKLSIVSRKAQTTRQQVLGILSREDWQVAFIDTPGVMEPRDRLQEFMVQSSFKAVSGADLAVVMVDARGGRLDDLDEFFNRLARIDIPRLLVINKVDLVEKTKLLPLIQRFNDSGLFEAIVPVSALHGQGVDELLGEIASRLPEGPFLYDPEQIATQPMRFFAAELIRETIFEQTRDELPYAATVSVDEYKERSTGKFYIKALIYVERDSQKKIIIGRKGALLKLIGKESRCKIEEFTGTGVFLELWVKVRDKWRKDQPFLHDSGFDRNQI